MTIVHRLAAYDRTTERLVHELDLSVKEFETLCFVARVPASYSTTFGSFPVDAGVARSIATRAELSAQVDWFLEASAVDAGPADSREKAASAIGD